MTWAPPQIACEGSAAMSKERGERALREACSLMGPQQQRVRETASERATHHVHLSSFSSCQPAMISGASGAGKGEASSRGLSSILAVLDSGCTSVHPCQSLPHPHPEGLAGPAEPPALFAGDAGHAKALPPPPAVGRPQGAAALLVGNTPSKEQSLPTSRRCLRNSPHPQAETSRKGLLLEQGSYGGTPSCPTMANQP